MGHDARRNAITIPQINQPPAQLYDRFARPVIIGGQYELHDSLPIICTVLDIAPNLDKDAPAGAWIVKLGATIVLPARQMTTIPKLTLVFLPKEPMIETPPGESKEEANTIVDAATPADPASDSLATSPQSSIVLTDMDRVARETLASGEQPQTTPPAPTPPPAPLPPLPPLPPNDSDSER